MPCQAGGALNRDGAARKAAAQESRHKRAVLALLCCRVSNGLSGKLMYFGARRDVRQKGRRKDGR